MPDQWQQQINAWLVELGHAPPTEEDLDVEEYIHRAPDDPAGLWTGSPLDPAEQARLARDPETQAILDHFDGKTTDEQAKAFADRQMLALGGCLEELAKRGISIHKGQISGAVDKTDMTWSIIISVQVTHDGGAN